MLPKTLLPTLLLLTARTLFAQNDYGKKVELQFKEQVSFFAVNDRYIPSKIYYADEGFQVSSGYDKSTIDGIVWAVFTYPNWKDKVQVSQLAYS